MILTEDSTPAAPIAEQQSFTSAQIAGSLFGCPLYGMYTQWQRAISQPQEAQHYASLESYIRVRDSVLKNVIGDLPTPEEYICFMSRIKTDVFELFAGRVDNLEDDTGAADLPVLVVATLCGHKIHPGNPCGVTDLCPACVMWQCTNSLFRIAKVWQQLGGPHRTPSTPDVTKMYTTVKRIWYLEKNRWSNLVFKYEGYATYEKEWEAQARAMSLQAREAVQDTQSCTAALRLAEQVPFLVEGWDKEFVPFEKGINAQSTVRELMHQQTLGVDELPSSPLYSPDSTAEVKTLEDILGREEHALQSHQEPHQTPPKTPRENTAPFPPSPTIESPVSPPSPLSTNSYTTSPASCSDYAPSPPPPFDLSRPHVTFTADVQDSVSRLPGRFKRKSTFYQPGKYACSSGSEWIDTSFMNDAMYDVFGSDDDEIEFMEAAAEEEHIYSDHCAEGFHIWKDTDQDLDPTVGLAVWNPVPPSNQQEFPDAIDPALLFDVESIDMDADVPEKRDDDEVEVNDDAAMLNADTDGAHVLATPSLPPSTTLHTHPLLETQTANVTGSHARRRSREELGQTELLGGGPEAKRRCLRDGAACEFGQAH